MRVLKIVSLVSSIVIITMILISIANSIFSITDESFIEEEYDTYYVSGTLTNNAPLYWERVSISYDFYNVDNIKISSGSDYCYGLKAGESWKFKVFYSDSEGKPAYCILREVLYY